MPNLIAHIDIALECRAKLCHPVIEANLGSHLLGSCSPDIRIITQGNRDDYHFAPISNQEIGTGVRKLFAEYPRMADMANLSGPTQAFMAGYISHLVADETWIIKIYRPYFGNPDVFPDRTLANVMDRAMQLEMDRQATEKHDGMRLMGDRLVDAHVGVEVDFLSADSLKEWREFLSTAIQREFTWERLGRMTRRQFPEDDGTAQALADDFVNGLPESLERVHKLVPREALSSYRNAIVREWSDIVQEYLP
ncbi:MAG: hypothetical protein V3S37_05335 [Dehalococcoidia bacterium]